MTQLKPPHDASVKVIDCDTAVRRLWDYLDGRLSAIAREEVEAHLATCELCPPHFEFAQHVRTAIAASGAPVPAELEVTDLRVRVRDALARLGGDQLPMQS
jgi:anti-sigma factor (TIGR02949 family)